MEETIKLAKLIQKKDDYIKILGIKKQLFETDYQPERIKEIGEWLNKALKAIEN